MRAVRNGEYEALEAHKKRKLHPNNAGRPKSVTIPENVDWSRRYREIAEEYGCSIGTVQKEFERRFTNTRKRCRIVPECERPAWQKFKEFDWSKKDAEIASIVGLTRERVRQIRHGLGIAPNRRRWDEVLVDWSKSDDELAKEFGTGRAAIYFQRRLRAPETCYKKAFCEYRSEVCSQISEADWRSLYNYELLAKLRTIFSDAPRNWVRSWKREHGYELPSKWNAGERYARADWRHMTKKEIAALVGVTVGAVEAYGKRRGLL